MRDASAARRPRRVTGAGRHRRNTARTRGRSRRSGASGQVRHPRAAHAGRRVCRARAARVRRRQVARRSVLHLERRPDRVPAVRRGVARGGARRARAHPARRREHRRARRNDCRARRASEHRSAAVQPAADAQGAAPQLRRPTSRASNRRMHNKSFTADNQATIVGGRNVGNEYFAAGEGVAFADLDVLAVGPVVRRRLGRVRRVLEQPVGLSRGAHCRGRARRRVTPRWRPSSRKCAASRHP